MSNPHADEMEKAEGSRETVNANLDENDPARERFDEQQQAERSTDRAGGITNRPLSRELEEQEQLPDRGAAKDPERDRA
jgi:hypothetical protein